MGVRKSGGQGDRRPGGQEVRGQEDRGNEE